MQRTIAILLAALATVGTDAARADSSLGIASDDLANFAALDFSGNGNGLSIAQSFDHAGAGNRLSGSVTGDENGLTGGVFAPALAALGLLPGQLIQSGHDNQISLTVSGSQNIFAASQLGSANALTASIIGNNNQAVILQVGAGNVVSFSQSGTANSLSVVQRSQ